MNGFTLELKNLRRIRRCPACACHAILYYKIKNTQQFLEFSELLRNDITVYVSLTHAHTSQMLDDQKKNPMW